MTQASTICELGQRLARLRAVALVHDQEFEVRIAVAQNRAHALREVARAIARTHDDAQANDGGGIDPHGLSPTTCTKCASACPRSGSSAFVTKSQVIRQMSRRTSRCAVASRRLCSSA